jgi:hypothetical protein
MIVMEILVNGGVTSFSTSPGTDWKDTQHGESHPQIMGTSPNVEVGE